MLGATREELRRRFGVHDVFLDIWAREHDDFAEALRVEPVMKLRITKDFGLMNWLKDYRFGICSYEQGETASGRHSRCGPAERREDGPLLTGNTGFGGRPKGARNKLTTEFFADFYAAWQAHGAEALKDVAEKSPNDFVRAAAMLMPKEMEIKTPLDDMTDADLSDLITAVQSLIAAGPLVASADGERAASKPH